MTLKGINVESFHLNVGAGDGAIHLLTCDPLDIAVYGNRRAVLQAYMVDGGKDAAMEKIAKVISRIEIAYHCPNDHSKTKDHLQFDGFIITHWDRDHYGGLIAWLKKQIHKGKIHRAHYENNQPTTYAYSPWEWPSDSGFEIGANGNLDLNVLFGAKNLLKVRTNADKLLGRNIFRYKSESPKWLSGGAGFANLEALLTFGNPIKPPDFPWNLTVSHNVPVPAMYCVSAERRVPGDNQSHLTTDTNMSSLTFIVVWSHNYRISHYFAGDAHWGIERRVAGWIDPNFLFGDSKFPITSMKLSHHGASTSNPSSIYYQYQPMNIIVSAGSQYGHPTWKVVMDIFSWYNEKLNGNNKKIPLRRPFLPCSWPYWLVTDENGLMKLKVKIIDLIGKKYERKKSLRDLFRKSIQTCNKWRRSKGNMTLIKDPLTRCFKTDFRGVEHVDLSAFREMCVDLMQKISVFSEGGINSGTSIGCEVITVGLNTTKTIEFNELLAIRVRSSPYEKNDGEAYVLGYNTQNLATGTPLVKFTSSNGVDAKSNRGFTSSLMNQDFPIDCSNALVTARAMREIRRGEMDDGDDENDDTAAGTVDMMPYQGFDRARLIDLTNGVPNWDTIRKMDQNNGIDSAQHESMGLSSPQLEHDEADDDWDDLDDWLSEASFQSSVKGEAQSPPYAHKASQPPLVSFQRLPADIQSLAARVYLTCQDERSPETPIKLPLGSEVCILDSENPLNGFMNTLHHQAIGLAEIPDTTNTTPIDIEDETFQWLARFSGWDPELPVPTGFALGMRKVSKWPITDVKNTRLEFEMTVPYLKSSHLRFSTDTGAELTFSKVSSIDKGVMKTGVTKDALKDFLVYRRSMVFGLEDLAISMNTNLGELATFLRFDLLSSPLFKYLAESVTLTLNTKENFHNAIWFRPSMDYETILRLQFHIDTTAFNNWLHTFSPSLKVDALQVIGRKKGNWVWAVPRDQMIATSSLTFLCRMTVSARVQLEGVFKCAEDSVTLTLTLNQAAIKRSCSSIRAMSGSDGILTDIMTWLAENFQLSKKEELDKVLKPATDSSSGLMSDNSILPRRIQVQLGLSPEGNITGVRDVSIDIEACLKIGMPAAAVAEQMPAVFLFNICWNKASGFQLKGKLWSVIPDTPFTHYDRALPEFEEYEYLQPVSPVHAETQLRTIDIARLLSDEKGKIKNLPAGIPNEIYLCEIVLSQEKASFTGGIRCSKPLVNKPGGEPSPPLPPTISLDKLELDASYTWGTKSPEEPGFHMRLAVSLDLYLGDELKEDEDEDERLADAAKLFGQVTYDRGNWSIDAASYNLKFMHLLQFWDLDDRGPISDFLGGITIDFIKLKYEFNNGKTKTGAFVDDGKDARSPNQLAIDGQFTFSNFASMKFEYANTGGDGWSLKAFLGPSEVAKDKATIGSLLSGFLDTVVVNSLPSGIRDAAIRGASGEDAFKMLIAKRQGVSVFALLVQVDKVSVWFVQLRHGPKGAVKRILKAAISKISVDVSALQTTINSPWEELFFMWVQDQTVPKEGVDALKGITQKEYEAMSEMMKDKLNVTDEQLLLFKPTTKKDTSLDGELQGPTKTFSSGGVEKEEANVVMAAGYHLVIVAKKDGKPGVILDYLFGAKKKPASSKMYGAPDSKGKGPDASGSEKGVKAQYKVKLGPLSVGNVGLWFKDGMIGVTLDANLIMGPIGLSLLGFTIGVPFGGDYSLAKPPPPSAIEWGLQGLILAMDKPPLTIAGGFMRDTSDPKVKVMYTGGLIVGFKPWSFEAMGAYATVYKTQTQSGEWITTIDTKPMSQLSLLSPDDGRSTHGDEVAKLGEDTQQTFTFSFIFVKMNGPLFSVGFADVAGLVGGFGINSDITLPTVEQVIQFPFVAERDSKEEPSPVERMQGLMKGSWFRPAEGLYWAAAGARVTAFQMFAANIVLVLQFGNSSLLFGIFGVATCDVPALDAPVKFAHVELGIVCTFDANSGIFKFEAQLSPRSFVLAPQCHLTGGMALFSWTKADISDPDERNRISAGDWVLTIGGYHRAFKPPKQYPSPPRLGISWSLSSCLSVKGEAYFAITPKVCMGGGKIRAALSVGLLYAWFDAFMDFLMNFEPFYFQMTARVSVGVRFTLDLWLVTIRISVEISAGLDLMGPPFGGIVHVDFWVFGFDIKFGSSPPAPSAIGLERFFKIATKTTSSTASSRDLLEGGQPQDKPMPDTAAILLTCETGLLPPLKETTDKSGTPTSPGGVEPDGGKWYVKGGSFTLNASFQIPVTSARLTEKRVQTSTTGESQEETRSADCTIDEKYKGVFAKPMQLRDPLSSVVAISVKSPEPRMEQMQDIHILADWKDQRWKLTAQVKPVQSSIWGPYNKNEDPSQVKGNIQGLLSGKNATMQLVTGISIVPPDPAMAGDKVNKFNVTKDHMASVFNPEGQKWPLFIGVSEKQDAAWEPKERGKNWDGVKDAWSGIGDGTTTKVVDLWAKRMRYDERSVNGDRTDGEQSGKFEPLRGSAPRKLLNRFKQLVPALPLVAVGY
ncbi:hypothetical protein FPRO06_13012 [Fusarium proliferatum]|nr:hypothetical protein FPRO06_13012 [Fusarium proliferatum]CVL11705.1 uncharacterized protein FPRN_14919 [Fusarium proliferatum]